MASHSVIRTATALLTVLCFLDWTDIPVILITYGMSYVDMEDFPNDSASYIDAVKYLVASEKVTLEIRPERRLIVADTLRDTVIQALNQEERVAAFNAAVTLLSRYWPWLTTYNATDVERLQIARKFRAHITALRIFCQDFEPLGFLPGLDFCAFLYEEAHLQIMYTTIKDMHLDCYEYGLRLAQRILDRFRAAKTDPTRKDQYERLEMNQARFVGVTASMLGKVDQAEENLDSWREQLKMVLISPGQMEDKRTLPSLFVAIAIQKVRCEDPDVSGAFEYVDLAINSVDKHKGVGAQAFRFVLPKLVRVLLSIHFRRYLALARSCLDDLLSEAGQVDGLIFEDMTSTETGIVLYAKGVMTYFIQPNGVFDRENVKKALAFLKRAVKVLEKTLGPEALWTLVALYRMAVCHFDLGQYDEAVVHLDTVTREFRKYTREFAEHDGADILWLKARALWKGGRALLALGDETMELEAQDMLGEAVKIYWDVSGKYTDEPSMTDAKWDELVFFLYR